MLAALAMLVAWSSPITGSAQPTIADVVAFGGGGWGHGVGMSQYGALARARAGQSSAQILSFYYPGTQIELASAPRTVRVWIADAAGADGVVLAAGARPLTITGAGRTVGWVGPRVATRLRVSNGALRIADDLLRGVDRVSTDLDPSSPVTTTPGGRFGRGRLEISLLPDGRLRVVVQVPIEEYLYGVDEMPASWPASALAAQAIAARTYVISKLVAGSDQTDCGCTVRSGPSDQVYAGFDKESGNGGARWVAAVDMTANKIVTYDSAPIEALYSSSNGGHTEASEDVFAAAEPYLRAAPDPYDTASPDHRWHRTYHLADLSRWLASAADTNVGQLQRIDILTPRTSSGRVGPARPEGGGVQLTGTLATKRVAGTRFQQVVNAGIMAEGGDRDHMIISDLFWLSP